EVHAVVVDVGQHEDFEGARERGDTAGAAEVRVVRAADRFAEEFVAPAITANALYEGKYALVSSLARPLIAQEVVAVAREVGADAPREAPLGARGDRRRLRSRPSCVARRRDEAARRADPRARRARRLLRLRARRHDREPPRRDQIAGDLRDAGGALAHHRAPRSGGPHARARGRPFQALDRAALGGARLRRALVLPAPRGARRVPRRDAGVG